MFKTFIYLILFTSILPAQTNHPEWKDFFNDYTADGCMVIFDENEQTYHIYNSERCHQAFLPASTFKLINSLIALETQAIQDEHETIQWDGINRNWQHWNSDHDLASALTYSVVWFYQELARRIGRERMQHWIDAAEYGNQNIGGDIDTFWLQGDIRISAIQQIDFLSKLYHENLAFSKRSQKIVKNISIREKNANFVWRYKTGWAMRVQPQVGWFVGILEEQDNVYYFAMNYNIQEKEQAQGRKAITERIFQDMHLLNRPD